MDEKTSEELLELIARVGNVERHKMTGALRSIVTQIMSEGRDARTGELSRLIERVDAVEEEVEELGIKLSQLTDALGH